MLNTILGFITGHPVETFIAIVVLAAIVYKVYTIKRPALVMAALYTVAVAEKKWGSKSGQLKYAEAYTYLKQKFPLFTFLMPQKVLKKIIEEALLTLKEILKKQLEETDQTKVEALNKLIQEYKDPDEEDEEHIE